VVLFAAFGYDIRWCFAVSEASQKHTACALGLAGRLAGCRRWQAAGKLKSICFSKISERTLGVFGGFFWLAFGNEITGGALLFRTRPKGIQPVLRGWLAGWLAAGGGKQLEKLKKQTVCFTSVSERTLGIFDGFFLLAFRYDIRWCPAVSEHHKSIQPVLWGLAGFSDTPRVPRLKQAPERPLRLGPYCTI